MAAKKGLFSRDAALQGPGSGECLLFPARKPARVMRGRRPAHGCVVVEGPARWLDAQHCV